MTKTRWTLLLLRIGGEIVGCYEIDSMNALADFALLHPLSRFTGPESCRFEVAHLSVGDDEEPCEDLGNRRRGWFDIHCYLSRW